MVVSDANNRVLSEQVAQLYRVAPIGIIASLINAGFLVVVLRLHVSTHALLTWLACLFGVSLLRALLLWQYHRSPTKEAGYGRWRNAFLVGLFAIGAVWGSVALFIYPESSLAHQVFIAFLVGGMVAGVAGALSFVHGAFLAFCLPALGPLVARFTLTGDEIHFLMGVILLLFCTLLFFSSRKNVKMVKSVFSLKLENTDLIAVLEEVNAALRNENAQHKKTHIELERYRDHLEELVANRTCELRETNTRLQEEIHQRQLVEEELQQRNRYKSEFISIASHELRTPLCSILGYSELLTAPGQFKDEEVREFLQIIQEKAEELEAIIDDLLDLSRVESGHPILLNKTNHEISQLIRHEVTLLQKISIRHQFHITFAEEPFELQIDVEKFVRVLENLLSNAVKFSPNGGTIVINAQRQGVFHQFSVSDDGIGMTPDQMNKVFGKFYRADRSNSAVSGLGLGMSIVKQIVETHGGRIWVQSEPGLGTTVSFTLPIEEVQPAALGSGGRDVNSSALDRREE